MNLLPSFEVICILDSQIAAEIPILVTVAMRTKNDFNIVAGITDSHGTLLVSASLLEREIDSTISLFPSDYANLGGMEPFHAGTISVHAMTLSEVENAIRAYDLYSTVDTYSNQYRSKLELGYRQLVKLSPRRMEVEIRDVVDGTLTMRIVSGSSAFPAMATIH